MPRGTKKSYFKKKKTRNNKNIRKQRPLKNGNKTKKRKQRRTRRRRIKQGGMFCPNCGRGGEIPPPHSSSAPTVKEHLAAEEETRTRGEGVAEEEADVSAQMQDAINAGNREKAKWFPNPSERNSVVKQLKDAITDAEKKNLNWIKESNAAIGLREKLKPKHKLDVHDVELIRFLRFEQAGITKYNKAREEGRPGKIPVFFNKENGFRIERDGNGRLSPRRVYGTFNFPVSFDNIETAYKLFDELTPKIPIEDTRPTGRVGVKTRASVRYGNGPVGILA